MNKGLSLISVAIFMAIIISAIAIVFQTTLPVVQKLQDSVIVDRMKVTLSDFDEIIRTVASEGKGSRRTISLDVEPGKLKINDSLDTITWEYETEAEVVSCRTSQKFGNLIFGCGLETNSSEGTYNSTDAYILENEHIIAYIKKIGTSSSHVAFNISDVIMALYQKDTNEWLNNPGFFDVTVNHNTSTSTGTGYTQLLNIGRNLPYATVSAFMNSSLDYYVNFTLETGLDFLIIEASVA